MDHDEEGGEYAEFKAEEGRGDVGEGVAEGDGGGRDGGEGGGGGVSRKSWGETGEGGGKEELDKRWGLNPTAVGFTVGEKRQVGEI